MAFNFPASANVGDIYNSGSFSFQFDGVAWNYVNTIAVLAYAQANAAYNAANSAARITFGTIIANGNSIIATSNNDTLTIIANANVSIVGNSSTKNVTFDLTDTGVVYSTYGNATTIPVFTVDNKGRLTSVTNTAIDTTIATSAFARANAANLIANLAFDKANTANVFAVAAFARANTANITADAAFARANAANLIANLAFDKANTANVFAVAAFARANAANLIANLAFDKANTANVFAVAAFARANAANITADAAFARANAANLIANLAYDKANTANVIAVAAFDKANNAQTTNSIVFISDTPPSGISNGTLWWNSSDGSLYIRYGDGNSTQWVVTFGQGSGSAINANSTVDVTTIANLAYDKANSANVIAVAAFNAANSPSNAVLKTGNTMTGNLVMSSANITFVTEVNSGIYWTGTGSSFIHSPAANTIVFGTSLLEDMRLDSSGRLGIATATPRAKFDIIGSSVGSVTTLTDGATITPDFASNNYFTVTLGGNRTLANATNTVIGQAGVIYLVQDGTGGRTVAFGGAYRFTDNAAPTLTTTANAVDALVYSVRTANSYVCQVIYNVGNRNDT